MPVPGVEPPSLDPLVILMIGALGTHAFHAEFPRLIPPLCLALAFLMYSARPRPRIPLESGDARPSPRSKVE